MKIGRHEAISVGDQSYPVCTITNREHEGHILLSWGQGQVLVGQPTLCGQVTYTTNKILYKVNVYCFMTITLNHTHTHTHTTTHSHTFMTNTFIPPVILHLYFSVLNFLHTSISVQSSAVPTPQIFTFGLLALCITITIYVYASVCLSLSLSLSPHPPSVVCLCLRVCHSPPSLFHPS